jgi:hypothetical protein
LRINRSPRLASVECASATTPGISPVNNSLRRFAVTTWRASRRWRAAYLAASDAARAVELIKASPDADPANDSITRLVLLARAHQLLGETDSACSTVGQLVEALKTKTPPRALQQFFLEAATTLGGLDGKQFYALLRRDTVDPESPD